MSRALSLRTRLVLASLVASTVAVGAAGVAIDRSVAGRLRANHVTSLTTVLEASTRRVLEDLRRARGGPAGRFDAEARFDADTLTLPAPPATEPGADGLAWLLRRPWDGAVLGTTEGFPALEVPAPAGDADAPALPEAHDLTAADGTRHRVVVHRIVPPAPRGPGGAGGPPRRRVLEPERPPLEVAVVAPLAEESRALAALRRALVIGGMAALVVAAALHWLLVGRGLAPLTALRRRIEALDVDRPGGAVALEHAPAELAPIADALEASSARLQRAFDRERRFTADAAHELRTPIAGLRAALEVVLRRERPIEMHRETAASCLAIARGMQDTVEALLFLARSAEAAPADADTVDVSREVGAAIDASSGALTARGVTIERSLAAIAGARASRALVARIAANLVGNIASHALPGTGATVEVTVEGDAVVLRASNECAALDPTAAEQAMEPFWRASAAREKDDEDHAGLGLAIVREAAEAMGGTATCAVEPVAAPPDDGARSKFTVTVRLLRS